MSDAILSMKGITKEFPGVKALSGVDFTAKKGCVHALVGENGAGKSTLMKVLGGVYNANGGEIFIEGKLANITCPKSSMELGISIIYQEFNLVPTLSIAENCFLGKEISRGSVMNRAKMEERAASVMERLGWKGADCSVQVRFLSVAQQQMVEIAKALLNNVKLLVMDEPTAVLTDKETVGLFEVIRKLKSDQISIVYISHRLEEVLELSDDITVLRDGNVICVMDNAQKQADKEAIVKNMVGRELTDYFPGSNSQVGEETVLKVEGLTHVGRFSDVSFTLKKGEVLGFSGLVGAGRTEVAKTIFGAMKAHGGTVELCGKRMRGSDILFAIEQGVFLVPEDRKREGLVLSMSLEDNICLPNAKAVSRGGVLSACLKKALVDKYVSSMSIRPALPKRLAKNFSGGNQQKAVIAKWLERDPKVLILDEPTRGIDVGSKAEIYTLIRQLTARGVSIIFISSEMMEIIGMCDRVIVMCEGQVTGEFSGGEITQESLMRAASNV